MKESRGSRLSYGSEVSLATKYGQLVFPTDEFKYYESLFHVLDRQNAGQISYSDKSVKSALSRCGLDSGVLEKAWTVCAETQSDNSDTSSSVEPVKRGKHSKDKKTDHIDSAQAANPNASLDLPSWLLFCRLLAHHVATKRAVSARLLKEACISLLVVGRFDFQLFVLREDSPALVEEGVSSPAVAPNERTVRIQGWHQVEGYPAPHIRFHLHVQSGSEESRVLERRYSDFAYLSSQLERRYRGAVLPPLPPKAWPLPPPAPEHIQARANDLQMFLDDLCAHPVIVRTFDLQVFLEASAAGWKSFM
eukprot:gene38633-46965_t